MRWWLAFSLFVSTTAHADWPVLGERGAATQDVVEPAGLFEDVDVYWGDFLSVYEPADLAVVARSALARLDRAERDGRPVPHGMRSELGIEPEHVRDTLEFISDIEREDHGLEHQRLADPEWLAAHFRVLRWHSDEEGAAERRIELNEGRIRLTRYLVYRFPGSLVRTDAFDTALYSVPHDERGLSENAAGSLSPRLLRSLLTRREVLDGVFEASGAYAGKADPLVYLSREHVHEALLQGTVQVELPDGTRRTYTVHRNNGRSYHHGVEHEDQERFWYFRESRNGTDGGVDVGVALRPGVAVAGDINNLGFGGLYALESDDGQLRLVILADTGGAFQPNLFQFDLFTGTHTSREALDEATRDVPRRPLAYMLVLR